MTDGNEPIVPYSTTLGLTKREYFASQIMAAMYTREEYKVYIDSEEYAKYATRGANKLIEQLNK